MAIFNMTRYFEDGTSTCSAIYSPQGEHLCCALEQGPSLRIPEGKHLVSEIGIGPYNSNASVKVGWHVVKSASDTAYRIPSPDEVRDTQRDNMDAFNMLMAMLKLTDEIRIVHA